MTMNIAINGRASKTQSAFRMEYSMGINIHASVHRVWTLMTQADEFPRWNTTIKSISGKIAAGETIQLTAAISPGRVFNLAIVEFVPHQKMVWSDGNAMFKGVRTYTFASKSADTTDFSMAEVYTGLMLPMIAGSLPDFRPVFSNTSRISSARPKKPCNGRRASLVAPGLIKGLQGILSPISPRQHSATPCLSPLFICITSLARFAFTAPSLQGRELKLKRARSGGGVGGARPTHLTHTSSRSSTRAMVR